MSIFMHPPHQAVVTRTTAGGDQCQYLRIDAAGAAVWIADPSQASAFASMREAARMAFRLPAALRAFGMPLEVEADIHRVLH